MLCHGRWNKLPRPIRTRNKLLVLFANRCRDHETGMGFHPYAQGPLQHLREGPIATSSACVMSL